MANSGICCSLKIDKIRQSFPSLKNGNGCAIEVWLCFMNKSDSMEKEVEILFCLATEMVAKSHMTK